MQHHAAFSVTQTSHFTILYTLYVTNITEEQHIGREGEKQKDLILSHWNTVIRWEMERKKVNSKGAIAAVLKYFELCLHVTVLLCKGEVGECV